jgi:cytochrome c-type biogenesis protein CcmH/NrfG
MNAMDRSPMQGPPGGSAARQGSTYIDQQSTPVLRGDAARASAGRAGRWIVALVVLVMLVIIGFSIYLTVKRYQLIGQALRTGNTSVALAEAAPEIGAGIGDAALAFR